MEHAPRENYFRELADIFGAAGDARPDPARIVELAEHYALDMDVGSVPGLCERFGLWHPLAKA